MQKFLEKSIFYHYGIAVWICENTPFSTHPKKYYLFLFVKFLQNGGDIQDDVWCKCSCISWFFFISGLVG
jgi:hypothetical protein